MENLHIWDVAHPFQVDEEYEMYHISNIRNRTPSFHSHDFYEIYFFISGDVSVYIEEHAYKLKPCDVVIFPPGRMHRAYFHDPETYYERMLVYITQDALKRMDTEGFSPYAIITDCIKQTKYHLSLDEENFERCRNLINEVIANSIDPMPYQRAVNHCRVEMLMNYLCHWFSEAEGGDGHRSKNRIAQVIAYINEHIAGDLSLDVLSARFFMSKYHLIRKFKLYTNRTVHQYILSKRINEAKLLMQSGVPPTDAYLQVGFRDYSSFYKVFCRQTGLSPKQYYKTLQ